MDRASEACGQNQKIAHSFHWCSRRKRESVRLKSISRSVRKHSKFGKRQSQRSWINITGNEPQEVHILTHYSQVSKNSLNPTLQPQIPESSSVQQSITYVITIMWVAASVSLETTKARRNGATFCKCWKRSIINPKFCTQQKYPLGMKMK